MLDRVLENVGDSKDGELKYLAMLTADYGKQEKTVPYTTVDWARTAALKQLKEELESRTTQCTTQNGMWV